MPLFVHMSSARQGMHMAATAHDGRDNQTWMRDELITDGLKKVHVWVHHPEKIVKALETENT